MADDDLIRRPEFDATMKAMTASMDGIGKKVEATKDDLVERLTRVEAKQDAGASQNIEKALAAAHEAGRTEARLEALEKGQRDDRSRVEKLDLRVWGLIILGLGALTKFALGLLAAGVP